MAFRMAWTYLLNVQVPHDPISNDPVTPYALSPPTSHLFISKISLVGDRITPFPLQESTCLCPHSSPEELVEVWIKSPD